MGEYYIRQSADGEVRGPFDEDQLNTLAEAGKITLETLIADDAQSNWLPVGDAPELKAILFPERKKLGIKKGGIGEDMQKLNKDEDANAPTITVEQMLAAAEGHTSETKHLKDSEKHMAKAASLALPVLGLMMLLSGLANTLPRYTVLMDAFTDSQWVSLLQEPFAVIGLIDFLIALGLFLNVASLFPVVRLRAMLGLGYFLFYYWSVGDPWAQVASVCAGLGLFICTLTLNLGVMILFAAVGVGGMGYLAWVAWTALSAAS